MVTLHRPSPAPFLCGLDLGQAQDHTALVLLERVDSRGAWDPQYFSHRVATRLHARLIHRFPLRTPYPQIVDRVRDVLMRPEARGRSHLIVDATGVGAPVVDLLRNANTEADITPVVITAGESESRIGSGYGVPKKDLVGAVAVFMQNRVLSIPKSARFADTLTSELHNFRVRFHVGGHTSYGAWREREHDDLVLAMALGCWKATRLWPEINGGWERIA